MRNLSQHWIGQILDHQRHPVRLGPTQTQQRTGLCFAGLQRNTGPSKFSTERHVLPIMRTFVQEEWLSSRHAGDIDLVGFQVIGKRLLDVEQQIKQVLSLRF